VFQKAAKKARLEELAVEIKRVTNSPTLSSEQKKAFFKKAEAEMDEISGELKAFEQAAAYSWASDANTGGTYTGMPGVTNEGLTNQCLQSPTMLEPMQLKALTDALRMKVPVSLEVGRKGWQAGIEFKSPVTESGLSTALPGIEMPNKYLSFPYEPTRLAAYLPGAAMTGPSAFWLSETAHGSEATAVTENTAKPDLSPTIVNNQVHATKLAAQFAVTLELEQDAAGDIGGFLLHSLQRSITNAENNLLLNAVSGTNGATFNGLLQTSGTLSQNASGLTGTDAIITAAAAMRSNSGGFSAPDLLIVSPNTAAGILMQKDNQGRYLSNIIYGAGPGGLTWNGGPGTRGTTTSEPGGSVPQGAEGGTLTLAGVPTIQTTQIADGSGALLSVRGSGAVYWTRLNMLIQFDPYTGLTNNTMRWVAETRIALSVPRPASVSILSNLPVG
jgi:hypothetical protein